MIFKTPIKQPKTAKKIKLKKLKQLKKTMFKTPVKLKTTKKI